MNESCNLRSGDGDSFELHGHEHGMAHRRGLLLLLSSYYGNKGFGRLDAHDMEFLFEIQFRWRAAVQVNKL